LILPDLANQLEQARLQRITQRGGEGGRSALDVPKLFVSEDDSRREVFGAESFTLQTAINLLAVSFELSRSAAGRAAIC
jgi:hypothetical protein